jgi:hypothetical protein
MGSELDPEVAAHIGDSYPHNLDYSVRRGRLKPSFKLWRRFRRIRKLYPTTRGDLLDLSSCKGFFVMEAAQHPKCQRAMGIDIHEPDLRASRKVAEHLELKNARFEELTVPKLARGIEYFGGAFETVLLINTYPYLFLGSDRSEAHVPDHRKLFEYMSMVTADRLIFSNRVELDALPRHIQKRAKELKLDSAYNPESIRAAAEEYFEVKEERALGRIPLWVLRLR